MKLKKIFLISFFGNAFEWYDFAIFAYLATFLGIVFFPKSNEKLALMQVFLVFFISYRARPIGSIIFGHIGDKIGRGISLKYSLFLMGIPSFLIAFIPINSSYIFYSVSIFIFLRLIQGIAAGGELPGSICYAYETSSDNEKNFMSSAVIAGSMLGMLSGSLIATILSCTLKTEQIINWGWRIPFFIGGFILIFLYYIRNGISCNKETFYEKINPLKYAIKNEYKSIAIIVMLYCFIQTSFYILFVWLPSYLNIYLNLARTESLVASSFGLSMLILFTLFFGYTANFFGKKKMVLYSAVVMILFSYPAFILIGFKNIQLIFFIIFIFALILGCCEGASASIMCDIFPKKIRCTGISVAFTLSSAVFGGGTPVLCSYLINKTGYTLIPVFLLFFASIAGLIAFYMLKNNDRIKSDCIN